MRAGEAALDDGQLAWKARAALRAGRWRTLLQTIELMSPQAKLDLEYCQVVAPIGGRVTKNYVDAGNLVGRGEPTLLAEIVKVSPAYVEVDVSEEDVLAVRRTNLEAPRDSRIEPGQVALVPGTKELAPGGAREQTRQVLQNLEAILEAAGTDLSRVVKSTVFLTDLANFQAMNEVYGEFFGKDAPARSTVAVKQLPLNALVEIEVIALSG